VIKCRLIVFVFVSYLQMMNDGKCRTATRCPSRLRAVFFIQVFFNL